MSMNLAQLKRECDQMTASLRRKIVRLRERRALYYRALDQAKRVMSPNETLIALEASIEAHPEWTLLQHGEAVGRTQERVRQLIVAHGLPRRAEPEKQPVYCKRCGALCPHECHGRPKVTHICTGCGVSFDKPSYRRSSRDARYTSNDRRFHSFACMNEWKSKNGSQWFVRRQPKEWGFGGRTKAAS